MWQMGGLVIGGSVLTLAGVAGLAWCVLTAMKARRAGLEGEAMAAVLKRVVVVNMAALALSGLGLMAVVFGLIAG